MSFFQRKISHKTDSNIDSKTDQNEQITLAEFTGCPWGTIQIVRSKRKSISLIVKKEGITIRAPLFSHTLALKAFALSKIDWLRKTQQRINLTKPPIKLNYVNGEKLLFMGKPITLHTLQAATGSSSSIEFNHYTQVLSIVISKRVKNEKNFIKKKVIQWYKAQALTYIQQHIGCFAEKMQVNYHNINIRDYKARWGSCSATGALSFNWRILMAPACVVDSVIVHELAHIKHFNHSKQFWYLVYDTYPDYKQQHKWLTENQHQLMR